jgi:RNA polymerase sigma-70 factor (ECF subfamily)
VTSTEPTQNRTTSRDYFATTRWTVVLAAGNRSTPTADVALEELCRTYWYPLYAFVRRHGHSKEDAEDLTQSFFARFLQKNYLEKLQSEHGKFRAFLLASLKHFLANEWDRASRQKRGGGIPLLPSTGRARTPATKLTPPTNSAPTSSTTAPGL